MQEEGGMQEETGGRVGDDGVSDEALLDLALGLRDDAGLRRRVRRSRLLRRRLRALKADLEGAEREFAFIMLQKRGVKRTPLAASPPAPGRDAPMHARRRVWLLVPALVFFLTFAGLSAAFGLFVTRPLPTVAARGGRAQAAVPDRFTPADLRKALAAAAGQFRQIVVAKAGQADGSGQVFSVVRRLRGRRLARLRVSLPWTARPYPVGTLYVLLTDSVTGPPAASVGGTPQFDLERSLILPLPAHMSPSAVPSPAAT